jgi:glycosyltransferase involved in cell wall biosynthesis
MATKKKTTTKKGAPKKTAPKLTQAPTMPAQKPKIRVLAYCDSPTCATGFGTVSRNILSGLYNTGRYAIDILGINYWGDPHGFPFRIWPTGTNAEKDPYGRKKVFNMIPRMEYDILFFLQDSFILDFLPQLHAQLRGAAKDFRSICYFPVDGTPKEQWMKNVSACDLTVAYSEYGKFAAQKAFPDMGDLLVIPHGANTSDYFVANENDVRAFKAQFFGAQAEKFVFTNLNRNQQRKDIPRTIAAFAEFRKHVPESLLYLHMAKQDQGWNLEEVVKSYGLNTKEDVIFPENFGPNQGYPRQIVNMIYNISDCVISTTLGEGWGLSWTEAMATKTPVIMPANTALVENITEDRGWLVKSGTNLGLQTVLPHDNEVIRPLVDTDDLVKTMLGVYNNREEAARRAENAYKWVYTQLNWQDSIVPKWVEVFDGAYDNLKEGKQVEAPETEKVIEAETF